MSIESKVISSSIVEQTQYDNKDFYVKRNFIDYSIEIFEYPRRQNSRTILRNSKNFEEISTRAAEKKMILLSDYAGTGKTTTFKHLSLKLKEQFPNYWISYIDIKNHLSECEENFQVLPVLVKILNITNEIDIDTFTNLYNADKVILLFDGFSGIPHKCKEFFIKLFKNVQMTTQNQQWIATQPQDLDIMIENLNQSSYKFVPFDNYRKFKFIRYHLRNLNIKNNAKKVFENLDEMVNGSSSFNESFCHPLMLQMICEFYLKNLHKSFNSYSFLNEMIRDKFKDAKSEESKLSIWQVHQAYALQICFKDGLKDYLAIYQRDDDDYESESDADQHESDIDTDSEHTSDDDRTNSDEYVPLTINIQKFQLLQKWKEEKSNWTADEISKYGLLDIDYYNTSDEFPAFKHKLLADFFVAQYTFDKLFDNDDSDEPKLIIELLLSKEDNHNRGTLISTLINHQTPKKFSDKMYKFAITNQMQRAIKNKCILMELFCCDERFLKVFRFAGNMTIIQKKIQRSLSYSEEMRKVYEKTLGAEWIRYTGFKLKDENIFTVPTDDEIDIIFDNDIVKELIDEEDDDSKYVETMCKKLFKFFCFVDRVKFPKRKFIEIFQYKVDEIFGYSFRSRVLIDKLIEIIRYNIDKCKDDFHEIFYENMFRRTFFRMTTALATDEYVRNIADFCDKFVKFSSIEADDNILLEHFHLRMFAQFCCFETFASLHDKYQICTQNEIQTFFIKYSVPIMHTITHNQLLNSVSKNLEIITKNIFDDKSKNQLRKFIENRYERKFEYYYYGHTILSFMRKEDDSEKYNEFYINGLKIAQNVLIKTARMLGMWDDEIEMLRGLSEKSIRKFPYSF